MNIDLDSSRLTYSETVAKTDDGRNVVFTDPMNKFIDDLVTKVEDGNGSGVTIDGGSLASPINAYIDGGTI